MTTGDDQQPAEDVRSESGSVEPPCIENILIECIKKDDVERLQQCYDNEEDPHYGKVDELLNKRDDDDDRAPVDLACTMGRLEILRFMIEKGVNTNIRDHEGKSPLDFACVLGRPEIVRELLENGSTEVDTATARGYTALHRAAAWDKLDCIKCLVEFGANMKMKTTHGERAKEIALRYNRTECAFYLDWAEARYELQHLCKETKETIEDPQKVLGRLTKDDKITALNACSEKQEWLETTENPTIEDFVQQKKEFEEILQPIQIKLSEPPPEKPHRR
ncbi:ankyrin repeat domain-containing protein 45-like [Saccoglossus kowalevskii]|uniref:Ankyrin repeat domain-containing protein 45-like n=1 Tax=Saccoglossus kowalevskii TaxID=10224 RepID=A0ABM0GVC8_SACKO|nr:PREDICTED: ankyrin repeat domain-containing protein 45-like [Saccoglossus kowalevskii]